MKCTELVAVLRELTTRLSYSLNFLLRSISTVSSSSSSSSSMEPPPLTDAPASPASTDSSPEFEFWMVGNNPAAASPPPRLLTADELFADGVLLPLDRLSLPPGPGLASRPGPPLTTPFPRRRMEALKAAGRTGRRGSSAGGAAELNIHIWPFTRSRSAGWARPRVAVAAVAAGRKVSSAPCSRSNSRGESPKTAALAAAAAPGGTKKWAPSVSRAGIHLGRPGPVWLLRRYTKARQDRKAGQKEDSFKLNSGTNNKKVLNLNVRTCVGYRGRVSCRSDGEKGEVAGDEAGGGGNGSLFRLRALFSKKVH